MKSEHKLYQPAYDNPALRGVEQERPWDVTEEIRRYVTPATVLLDIGCGTCRKIMPLAPLVREIWGLEPSAAMRDTAAAQAAEEGLRNLHLVDGVAEHIPFPDNCFDIVCCFVAPHITSEVYRVLKPSGITIVEKIGERDKFNIKEIFGADGNGPRGQFMQFREGERADLYREEFGRLFSSVEVRAGRWKTYLSRDGLVSLCEHTNTIRGFDRQHDAGLIDEIVRQHMTPAGIETVQHRILIVAVK